MAIALITGGGSGIGAATGTLMARNGDTVILADINSDAADSVAAQIVASGGKAESAALDVRDAQAFNALVDRVVADHGRIDLVFNNAGIGVGGPIEDLTLEHWQRVVDINIMGVVNGIRAVYPHMIRQGDGHIVNTASLAGLVPSPLLAPYAMTKHAVVGLSLSLRPEAAVHGIRVTALCPGPTETPILDSTGPADLPANEGVSARELLTKATGSIYPVDDLAADLVAGIEANRSLIVTPQRARLAWWVQRLVPSYLERHAGRLVSWAKREVEKLEHAAKP
ncbi:MAG: SDR family oxidoreductase [Candidatus Nanopelagicales bacterium]|jgi:NAD(P)-dependent dehydrogenase (short-subunit alcohol dehydrogenase family)|nr:SDR family oxidoreductase [Candidatus Nanopelagicales bacterium]